MQNSPTWTSARIPHGIFFARCIIVLLSALLALSAGAHESDEPFANWYRSLKQNGSGISCCSYMGDNHDCETVEYRISSDGYEALSNGEWIKVPDDKVLKRENPTGRAVLCRLPSSGVVLCFVPPSQV